MISQKTLLACQPVYTANEEIFGSELLFRHDDFASAAEYGEDLATKEVILNLCTGINQQLHHMPDKLFINFSANLLDSNDFLPLPTDAVIIELPASIDFNDKLIERILAWRQAGFRFSLDDFDFSSRLKPLIKYFDYIKVDALDRSLESKLDQRREYSASPQSWVAKRVETKEQYQRFKNKGFTLFQGYFLAEPEELQGQPLRGKITNTITTINSTSLDHVDINSMVRLINRDPVLATQLLRIVNSPVCALVRPVSSIKDAVVFLGLVQVRKWIVMMSMLNDSSSSVGAVNLILTRARACENYAAVALSFRSDQAFLIGLLSGVRQLFGIDKNQFLSQVPLQKNIKEAVLYHKGLLGQVLSEIKTVEYQILQQTANLHEQDETLLRAYQDAHQWTEQVLSVTATAVAC